MNVVIDGNVYYNILINTVEHIDKNKPQQLGTICFELDEEMGLELIGEDSYTYSFRVIDEKKWMIAKLKWGL